MAHFAKIENHIVVDVIVADQEHINKLDGMWRQTSYNTRGGIHYDSDGNPDGGLAIRANYAAIGDTYDENNDVFYKPQPYPSWTISAPDWEWKPPIPHPDDIVVHRWDEENKSWVK